MNGKMKKNDSLDKSYEDGVPALQYLHHANIYI